MALSAGKKTTYSAPGFINGKVKAATTIYPGAMVCFDSTGYLIPAAEAVGNVFAGLAQSDGTARVSYTAGENVPVYTNGIIDVVTAGADQTWVGTYVAATDDQTVEAWVAQVCKVGRCVEYISATKIRVNMIGVI